MSVSLRLVEVAVAAPVRRTYTYKFDPVQELVPGMRLLVPFGRRLVMGYIVGFPKETPVNPGLLRPVRKVLDFEPVLSPALLQLGFWLAEYYLAPPGEVLRTMLPAGLNLRGDHEVTLLKIPGQPTLLGEQNRIVEVLQRGPIRFETLARRLGRANLWEEVQQLKREGIVAVRDRLVEKSPEKTALFVGPIEGADTAGLTVLQRVALDQICAFPEAVRLAELVHKGVSPATVRSLEKKRCVSVERRAVRRNPLYVEIPRRSEELPLTPQQEAALGEIREAVRQRRFHSFLLHGVTGSGKTEVYLRAIAAALEQGMSAMMLVPEIGLTPALSRTVQAWFGEHVAILHSALSAGERRDEWQRIRRGEARVVIGTRSAVFCPLDGPGLIIVDEEQDSSYKQEEQPVYNARDTALVRGRSAGATVVLGSATPALETFFQARRSGKHTLLSMPERVHRRPLPEVRMVDMRSEFQKHGKASIISEDLQQAIADRLARREQVMILLNRRGYAPVLLCRSCGSVATCEHCSVSLTYHQAAGRITCHYCGAARPLPGKCEACGGQYLFLVGEGTEQIHEILGGLFPSAGVDRLDRDTTRGKGGHDRILHRFDSGATRILVGTQMIAKGHDFHNVTLVGVLNADAGLRVADFRSAERTFQLVTQVAGRAGRGDTPGEVVVQTYYPGHYALQCAARQDYQRFYQQEIRYRRLFSYPPFTSLALAMSHDPDRDASLERARHFAGALRQAVAAHSAEGDVRILGPAEAAIGKLKGIYRFQVLIKSSSRTRLHVVLREALRRLEERKRLPSGLSLDVDPLQV